MSFPFFFREKGNDTSGPFFLFAGHENQKGFHPYIGVMDDTNSKPQVSQKVSNFLWWCAGTVPETLRQYPTEKAKYEGIGGAVLTTGILAFLSGFYAIYTTIATGTFSVLIADRIWRDLGARHL